jgi:hypothetical protein
MASADGPEDQVTQPKLPASVRSSREARRAEALRENLKRRKAQLRGRADAASGDAPDSEDK